MSDTSEQIEAKLAAYVDGALSPDERQEIEAHLQANPTHRALISDLIGHRNVIRGLPREDAPRDLSDELMGGLEREALLTAERGEHGDGVLFRIFRSPSLLSAAAILVLAIGLGALVYVVLPPKHPVAVLSPAPVEQEDLQPEGEMGLDAGALADAGSVRRGGSERIEVYGGAAPAATVPPADASGRTLVIRVSADDVEQARGEVVAFLVSNNISYATAAPAVWDRSEAALETPVYARYSNFADLDPVADAGQAMPAMAAALGTLSGGAAGAAGAAGREPPPRMMPELPEENVPELKKELSAVAVEGGAAAGSAFESRTAPPEGALAVRTAETPSENRPLNEREAAEKPAAPMARSPEPTAAPLVEAIVPRPEAQGGAGPSSTVTRQEIAVTSAPTPAPGQAADSEKSKALADARSDGAPAPMQQQPAARPTAIASNEPGSPVAFGAEPGPSSRPIESELLLVQQRDALPVQAPVALRRTRELGAPAPETVDFAGNAQTQQILPLPDGRERVIVAQNLNSNQIVQLTQALSRPERGQVASVGETAYFEQNVPSVRRSYSGQTAQSDADRQASALDSYSFFSLNLPSTQPVDFLRAGVPEAGSVRSQLNAGPLGRAQVNEDGTPQQLRFRQQGPDGPQMLDSIANSNIAAFTCVIVVQENAVPTQPPGTAPTTRESGQ